MPLSATDFRCECQNTLAGGAAGKIAFCYRFVSFLLAAVIRCFSVMIMYRSIPLAAPLLLEVRGSVLTRGHRRVLAAADLLMPLLKLLAVALYLPVLVGADR